VFVIRGADKEQVVLDGGLSLWQGFELNRANGCTLKNLTIRNYREFGIIAWDTNNCIFEDLHIDIRFTTYPSPLYQYGLVVASAISEVANNTIRNTIVSGSKYVSVGIYLFNAFPIEIDQHNAIENNLVQLEVDPLFDPSQYGILLYGSRGAQVKKNRVMHSFYGIGITGHSSKSNIIQGNIIESNNTGFTLRGLNTDNDIIIHNNFVDNVQGASIHTSSGIPPQLQFDDEELGNFWSDYTGTDNDHNGVGDTPYLIYDENRTMVMGQDRYPSMSLIGLIQVWPGDTNDDGIVDDGDEGPISQYFGYKGPAREDAGDISWKSHPALQWNTQEATYADANGDGVVNQADVLVVGLNFGRTRNSNVNQTPEVSSPLEVSPEVAYHLQEISFSGQGTDQDGQIVAYSWRSSLDGELSTSASFTTRKLSVGEHTISFKVQDNEGAWSEETTRKVTIKRWR
jgi:parallel beta-helix repeat protein